MPATVKAPPVKAPAPAVRIDYGPPRHPSMEAPPPPARELISELEVLVARRQNDLRREYLKLIHRHDQGGHDGDAARMLEILAELRDLQEAEVFQVGQDITALRKRKRLQKTLADARREHEEAERELAIAQRQQVPMQSQDLSGGWGKAQIAINQQADALDKAQRKASRAWNNVMVVEAELQAHEGAAENVRLKAWL